MTLPSQPATIAPCPKCGGKRVGAHIEDAVIRANLDFMSFSALVCTACGFSELYINQLNKLLQAIEKQPKQFRH